MLECIKGCCIGLVVGMAVGTALGAINKEMLCDALKKGKKEIKRFKRKYSF